MKLKEQKFRGITESVGASLEQLHYIFYKKCITKVFARQVQRLLTLTQEPLQEGICSPTKAAK
jgi:hypothetical protein